jgi:hypothetical protein
MPNDCFIKEKRDMELNLSLEELEKRTSPDYMSTIKLLAPDAPEYQTLAPGDKEALKYMTKAANVLGEIELRLDSHDNLAFRDYLERNKGKRKADLTKILFDAQKGINAVDREAGKINLAKDIEELPGKGFYPKDLSKEEFHGILKEMLEGGKSDEVARILNQRSVVERGGNQLKAIDYVDYFKPQFTQMADLFDKAAEVSTNADFNEYLRLQAKALRVADPMLDAQADKKWAQLQDTPLEFTITREGYSEELGESVLENPELKALLDEHKIQIHSKDSLGGRVGIVNKAGTQDILKIKDYLPVMAANMPYSDEYTQTIGAGDDKQTMVDVDLVAVTGDVGAYRAGITLAENLPNDDKLSLTIGGGRRNVYHRQIRLSSEDKKQKQIAAVLDAQQLKFYDANADHIFTIGHENVHSLGPKDTTPLGKYQSIIEENKADMGSLAFLDLLVEKGCYTKTEADAVAFSAVAEMFLKAKPHMSQAHRVRTVMQNKFFFDRGVYELNSEGKIHIYQEKIIPAAKEMLAHIVRIQTDKSFDAAQKFIEDNFVWTPEQEIIAERLKAVDKTLNGRVESELADYLTSQG